MKKHTYLTILFSLLLICETSAQLTFQKTFGGPGTVYGTSVKQTSDGGYIVAGGLEDSISGKDVVYLIKLNANGDSLWIKTYTGPNDYVALTVQQTTDGGYILGGSVIFSDSTTDLLLMKTDSTGTLQWTKSYGAAYYDYGYS